MNEQQEIELSAGWLTAALLAIPIIVTGLNGLVGAYKTFVSSSGKIKTTKNGVDNQWSDTGTSSSSETSSSKSSKSSGLQPIYFTY